MRSQTRERIYLIVTVFCLLLCAVLLLSVFLDRPVFGGPVGEHVPVIRVSVPENETAEDTGPTVADSAAVAGQTVTEERLTDLLAEHLAAPFSGGAVTVHIGEDGAFTLACRLERAALIDWLESSGTALTFRQGLALRLLPRKLDVELCLNAAGKDGLLALTPRSLEINDEEIALDGLPSGAFEILEAGVNAALQAVGCTFTTVEFMPGALIFR